MTELLATLVSDAAICQLAHLEEGLESQTFAFEAGGDAFVLRISASRRGFEKDRWAADAAGRYVPVPTVEAVGDLDSGHAYCVTRRLPGGRALPRVGRNLGSRCKEAPRPLDSLQHAFPPVLELEP